MATQTVFGEAAIQAAFRRVRPSEARKVARQAARASGRPILAAAKRDAPRGPTKRLSKGITLRATKRSRVYVGVRIALPKREKLQIRSRFYYPSLIHYGFRHRKGKDVAGTFWLDRAFDSNVRRAEGIFVRTLTDFAERMR